GRHHGLRRGFPRGARRTDGSRWTLPDRMRLGARRRRRPRAPGIAVRRRRAARNVPALGAILLVLASPAYAVPIRVVFDDPTGAGFNDPQLGPARRAAFRFAVGIWASAVRRSVPVVVGASMASLGVDATSAPLARPAAYSLHRNFPGAPQPDTWYPAALASQLRTPPGDVNDAEPEIVVVVNADIDQGIGPGGKKFDYGTD